MAFEAKYHGVCNGCGEAIEPGELVTYVEDVLQHTFCPDPAPEHRAEVCQECWIEKPCGCGEF